MKVMFAFGGRLRGFMPVILYHYYYHSWLEGESGGEGRRNTYVLFLMAWWVGNVVCKNRGWNRWGGGKLVGGEGGRALVHNFGRRDLAGHHVPAQTLIL